MKRGAFGSSSSARRSVRIAWASAPSVTMTSLHTTAKISPLATASARRTTSRWRTSKYLGISGTMRPSRDSVRPRGESTNGPKR